MSLTEQYLNCLYQASAAFGGGDKDKFEQLSQDALATRNKFTKADWEALIAQSSGRAKFEYTRMMNEKFSK